MKTDTMLELAQSLRERAAGLGFDDVGFCSVAPFYEWREKAYELVRRRIAHDPRALMPLARCIIVAVRRYAVFGDWPEGTAEVANYYTNSTVGFEEIKKLADVLTANGYNAIANPLLPAKQAALRAGLGLQGMNTQFCHNKFGVLVSLHMILTDAPLKATESHGTQCRKCSLCASACPGGAIQENSFDHQKCLRFHMANNSVIPLQLRDLMGLRLIGCTDCQHCCPDADIKMVEVPADLAWACSISGLLEGDVTRYEKLAGYIGENFARPKRIRPQAAICAGNSGNRAYVPLLAAALGEEGNVLRCHAAWALGKLGGSEASKALLDALQAETDETVKNEIQNALNKLS